jgi:hypothetical protein
MHFQGEHYRHKQNKLNMLTNFLGEEMAKETHLIRPLLGQKMPI